MAALPARTVTLALTIAALGTVMMVMALFVSLEWPSRIGFSAGRGVFIGILLAAPAQFLYAVAADLLFPGADGRATGAYELAPWVVFAITIVGGLTWLLR